MSIVATTYATLTEANTINGEAKPWDDSDDEVKQPALEWATVYMDSHYRIPVQTTIPEVLKNANAILANAHITEDLFFTARNAQPQKGLKSTEVKANPVGSKKEFDPIISGMWQDPFPHVSAMMNNAGFSITKSGGFGTVALVRR